MRLTGAVCLRNSATKGNLIESKPPRRCGRRKIQHMVLPSGANCGNGSCSSGFGQAVPRLLLLLQLTPPPWFHTVYLLRGVHLRQCFIAVVELTMRVSMPHRGDVDCMPLVSLHLPVRRRERVRLKCHPLASPSPHHAPRFFPRYPTYVIRVNSSQSD